jgi:hypothetical protein
MQHVPMPRKVPKSSNVLELRGRMPEADARADARAGRKG